MLRSYFFIIHLQGRTKIQPSLGHISYDGVNSPPHCLHHLVRVIHRPHHQTLSRILALSPELFTISSGQRAKSNRKSIAIIPEILPCDVGVSADVGPSAIRQLCLCGCDKTGMPQTQDNSGSQSGLPIGLSSYNLMHQCEELQKF